MRCCRSGSRLRPSPRSCWPVAACSRVPTDLIPTQRGTNPLAPPQIVLDAARTAQIGSVLPEVFEENGVYYVAQLTERTEPDMAKFEEEREEIRERVLGGRRMEFYQGWVDDLKAQATIE